MASFKTTKYVYDGIFFMSQPEIEVYKLLKENNINFEYQPTPITITPSFITTMGIKHNAMIYEPDFLIKYGNRNVYLEVKSQNDLIFAGKTIKDNSEMVRTKHKQIENYFSNKKRSFEYMTVGMQQAGYKEEKYLDKFLVVRVNNLKTPTWSGIFWEEEFTKLKRYKTQGKNELCASINRLDKTLAEIEMGFYDN